MLPPQIHFFKVKEKGLPSYKNEYYSKTNLFEQSSHGREDDLKRKKASDKIYFAKHILDKDEKKLMGKEIKDRKDTKDVMLKIIIACIYTIGEMICMFLGHKLYASTKNEETERKLIEEKNKRKGKGKEEIVTKEGVQYT